jgi:hypothetical protein
LDPPDIEVTIRAGESHSGRKVVERAEIKPFEKMKNFTSLLFAATAAAVLLASCKSAPKVVPTFDAIDNEINLPTTTGNFEVKYHFEFLSTLADQAVLQRVQLDMASDMFGPEFAITDAGGSVAAFDASVPANYGVRADSTAFRWDGYLHLTSTAALVGEHIASYVVNRAEDTGGAHPMETTRASNFDLRTGDRLTLDALFSPEGKAALADAIRAAILRNKGVATW